MFDFNEKNGSKDKTWLSYVAFLGAILEHIEVFQGIHVFTNVAILNLPTDFY